jgi:hypothetical protein
MPSPAWQRKPTNPTAGRAQVRAGNPLVDRPVAVAASASVMNARGQMRLTTTGEDRLDGGKAMGCSLARRATRRFGCKRGWLRSNFFAAALMNVEDHGQRTGNTGNVG